MGGKPVSFSKRFEREIEKRFPFLRNQPILLAVSGGLDSMAMLHLFLETRERLDLEIAVAHINHNLRPTSCRDSYFVDNFCQKAGVPCYLAEIDRNFWDGHPGNREEQARKERYRLLGKIAKDEKIKHVATAHQRDDQVETLLMRLFDRGTGLHGLAGIPAVTEREGLIFVRPLLPFSREELRTYMSGRDWVEDESNQQMIIRRNFYRHQIVPFLRNQLGPSFENHLLSLAEEAARYREVLEIVFDLFWLGHRRGRGGEQYVLKKEEVLRCSASFWESALGYLFRKARGYTYGKRTIRDIKNFIMSSGVAECSYGPVRLQVSGKEVTFTVQKKP